MLSWREDRPGARGDGAANRLGQLGPVGALHAWSCPSKDVFTRHVCLTSDYRRYGVVGPGATQRRDRWRSWVSRGCRRQHYNCTWPSRRSVEVGDELDLVLIGVSRAGLDLHEYRWGAASKARLGGWSAGVAIPSVQASRCSSCGRLSCGRSVRIGLWWVLRQELGDHSTAQLCHCDGGSRGLPSARAIHRPSPRAVCQPASSRSSADVRVRSVPTWLIFQV